MQLRTSQKGRYQMILLTQGPRVIRLIEMENRMVIARHWEEGEGELIFVSKELECRMMVVMMVSQGMWTRVTGMYTNQGSMRNPVAWRFCENKYAFLLIINTIL